MATFKAFLVLLPVLVIVFHLNQVDSSDRMVIKDIAVESTLPQNIDCGGACEARCELSSRPNLCHRACGTCCARCQCVPPGTSGNYDACPCYGNMTTHGGKHKCP